jgi:cytochrome c oxidase assembly protein subunit 15
MTAHSHNTVSSRSVFVWYVAVATLIAALVLVGGITRLTGSGLSITRWDVVSGAIPPLTERAWNEAFDAYRESPQYRLVNAHFELGEFKGIYWWEWAHRLLGRLLGLALFVPGVLLAIRGQLSAWLRRRTLVVLTMVLLQGVLGWLMVASGLVDEPRVSHFRLAAHLSMALATYCVVLWTALEAAGGRRSPLDSTIAPRVFSAMLAVQIVWGAFVAGLHAGGIHPTWPTIQGQLYPAFAFESGWLTSVLHHPTAVQFVHRTQGATLLIGSGLVAWRTHRLPAVGRLAFALIGLVVLQFVLGVATVLHFGQRPVLLGSLHQFAALILVSLVVVLVYRSGAGRGSAPSVRVHQRASVGVSP